MEENLVIVESPAKAKTIEKFLGKDFLVKSSFGHIRDLSKKNGINIENNFEPQYEISADKKKIVAELKKISQNVKTVWLASDEDREGEAIAWHLFEALKLKKESTKRIAFHEITKEAILNAIENPRGIDYDLVLAQQARRILDRLVGFELSPVLWKKVRPALSAGRVQSVAVRLIVEREREITSFISSSYYKVVALFILNQGKNNSIEFKAELQNNFNTKEEAVKFLEKCINAEYTVTDLVTKPSTKSPAPPFTTSTLQQEASRKLGFSVSQTMTIAQKLYEAGKITYMRTDSVTLSKSALSSTKAEIISEFGEKYSKTRNFITKSKGAQEAHEAIRPTYINNHTISGSSNEQRLYDLIWKRTIASQMSEAKIEKTSATVSISTNKEIFVATGEVLKFDGFLRIYNESSDDDSEDKSKNTLPNLKINDKLLINNITATEKFTHHPPRYAEASLVRKLEELGIGRPSTYAPIISTIQNRGYVIKEDKIGINRKFNTITLSDNLIKAENKTEITGAEKAKLVPTDIGIIVNDFLVEHFDNILDYNFTANVEKEFDEIAIGKLKWNKMIESFYIPFHQKIDNTIENSERNKGERLLGNDPVSGEPVSVKIGKYGPIVQLGETTTEKKPKFASLMKGQRIDTISLEQALDLFKLPRNIGLFENEEVVVSIGKFGPYIRHNSKFYSLKKEYDPLTIELKNAIEIIKEKRQKDISNILKTFDDNPEIKILNGRWGPYIYNNKQNFKIPKNMKIEEISVEECLKIIEEYKKNPPKKFSKRKQ